MSPVPTVRPCDNHRASGHTPTPHSGALGDNQSYKVALCNRFLRSRFQGALMGLALVPVVCPIDAIAYHQTSAVKLMETFAPGLLRHHDHWKRRRQWVAQTAHSQTSIPQASKTSTSTSSISAAGMAQLLLAGDWLEAVITNRARTGRDITNRNTWSSTIAGSAHSVDTYLHRYNFSDEQVQCYQGSYRCLHRIFGQDAAIAKNYALSIQTMSAGVYSSDTFAERESVLLMTAIIGFLVGAAGGLTSIPVLWQMNLDHMNPDCMNLDHMNLSQPSLNRHAILVEANRLYQQWAGVLDQSLTLEKDSTRIMNLK